MGETGNHGAGITHVANGEFMEDLHSIRLPMYLVQYPIVELEFVRKHYVEVKVVFN